MHIGLLNTDQYEIKVIAIQASKYNISELK